MEIVEYLARMGVETRKSGHELKALCPFHHEADPSFYVNPEKGLWICRGKCNRGGSIVDLIMLNEGVSLRQAMTRVGSAPTPRAPVPVARQDPLTAEVKARLSRAAGLYEKALDTNAHARHYLTGERGLDPVTINRYHLGFCPEHGGDIEPPLGDGHRATLANQVVIPEFHDGLCIYLQGRRLAPGEPRYMGLHNLPKPLYGFSRFAHEPTVYLVEGLFDWLSLLQWGLPTVAGLGCHLSPAQAALISGRRVVLCQDADVAGDLAAQQMSRILPKSKRVRPPPPFKDWSEALTAGWKRDHFLDYASQFAV
jgi:DNA primase